MSLIVGYHTNEETEGRRGYVMIWEMAEKESNSSLSGELFHLL